MDLIARDSDGASLVAREEAEPWWQPTATVGAARVDLYRRYPGQSPAVAVLVGSFKPGEEVTLDHNPVTDQNILYGTISYSAEDVPSVSRLEDAVWATLLFDRGDAAQPASDSVDDAVPVVTQPPTVTKSDTSDDWTVFVPMPDAKGYSTYAGEGQVRKESGGTVLRESIPFGLSATFYAPCYAFDCEIRYRWRNQYRGGGADGWSDWSPWADAFGLASESGGVNPLESAQVTFDRDPNDVKNPETRETMYGE